MSTPSLSSEYSDSTALATRIETHENYSEYPDNVVAAVINALGLEGSEDVADIGCGDARFLARLASTGHGGRLVGVDNSPAMVAAANRVGRVTGVLADAVRTPFSDSEFDAVTVRHMLYHLDDPMAALEEFRRIAKPWGQVVVTVNHSTTCRRTHELVAEHAERRGITAPAGMINGAVNSGTISDMMAGVFGNVHLDYQDNALVFPEPEPLIRFAESLFSFCGVGADHPERGAILADLTSDVEEWFATHPGGAWRDPKGYVVAVSEV
ncbi:class I SAM-dependent methyltransferase [Nocardia sp. BMG51109]|uniref:class I SAM-dependent methyltransferase n=1 Tax=Nocardia sp. BMG51109 TaxID=1056816 RepID=UPI000467A512|nr:class I SAM-dependent methyltransferase [Nocardia sp. BMG51109]